MCLFLVSILASPAMLEEAAAKDAAKTAKPKVVVLATGGTIAGVGEEGKTAGYKPGSLTAE